MEEHGTCPTCSDPLRPGARFCAGCGHELPEAIRPPPPAATPPEAASKTRRKRRRRRNAGGESWRTLVPALQLWLILLAANGLLGLASHLVDISSPSIDLSCSLLLGLVIVAFCVNDREAISPLLRRSGLTLKTFWAPFAALFVLAGFMQVYIAVLATMGGEFIGYLDDYRDHGWPLWTAFIAVSLFPAVFEELAFRGFIMHRLEAVMRPGEAMVVQAALFSVLHMMPLIFPSHFVMGLIFGVLRSRTRSLYPGIAVHMAWNAWVLIDEIGGIG